MAKGHRHKQVQFHVLRTDRRTRRREKKSACTCKKRAYCINKSIMSRSAMGIKTHAKTCLKSFPKPSPVRRQTLQNRGPGRHSEPKCSLNGFQTKQEALKTALETATKRSRSAQEGPGAAQECPTVGQVTPKSRPRRSKIEPRAAQDEILARSP